MRISRHSQQNYSVTLSPAPTDIEFYDYEYRVSARLPASKLFANAERREKQPTGAQPYYALREIDGEIVVDLCEVRGLQQRIVRANYLRAPNAIALRSQLTFYPCYPIASIATPTLRCRPHLNDWPL